MSTIDISTQAAATQEYLIVCKQLSEFRQRCIQWLNQGFPILSPFNHWYFECTYGKFTICSTCLIPILNGKWDNHKCETFICPVTMEAVQRVMMTQHKQGGCGCSMHWFDTKCIRYHHKHYEPTCLAQSVVCRMCFGWTVNVNQHKCGKPDAEPFVPVKKVKAAKPVVVKPAVVRAPSPVPDVAPMPTASATRSKPRSTRGVRGDRRRVVEEPELVRTPIVPKLAIVPSAESLAEFPVLTSAPSTTSPRTLFRCARFNNKRVRPVASTATNTDSTEIEPVVPDHVC